MSGVYGRLLSRNDGSGYIIRANLTHTDKDGITNTFPIGKVTPLLFRDIFEVNIRYLPNGEFVDLHDDYSNCKKKQREEQLTGTTIRR